MAFNVLLANGIIIQLIDDRLIFTFINTNKKNQFESVFIHGIPMLVDTFWKLLPQKYVF